MHIAEKLSIALRHSRYLAHANWIWDGVRPIYNGVVARAGKHGLERLINGTDRILLSPRLREVSEEYEPEVWNRLMDEIRPGDVFVDVGVYIGLYTIAAAKRIGPTGRVVGFEPDPLNYSTAKEHIVLNGVAETVNLIPAAVGAQEGLVQFKQSKESGHLEKFASDQTCTVECVTLDSACSDTGVDVLKLDVEGYEEDVLRGASNLLNSPERRPRTIFIEVHPYAWQEIGVTSESLLELLGRLGYSVFDLNGEPVERIVRYGEIIATTVNRSAPLPPAD